MTSIPPAVADYLAAHHGIVNTDTLMQFGFGEDRIRSLVDAGMFVRVHRQVLRIRSTPASFLGRCRAACAAHPALVITGVSAGRMWELRRLGIPADPPPDELIEAIAPARNAPSLAGVRVRRSTDLDERDIVERPDGIRLATAARTWFDIAESVGDRSFESITEQVLDRYCSVPELWATRRRLAVRGRNGAARVNRVLDRRAVWQRPADSDLELRVLLALEARGVSLVRQFELRLRDGSVIHLDGADPLLRWGLEVDHVTWHGGRFDAQRDKARDRQAGLLGWRVERVTDADVAAGLDVVVDELAELHAMRSMSATA